MRTPLEVARSLITHWNADRLEEVYALWDPEIVVRPDADWPEVVCHGAAAARRFWQDQRELMGEGVLIIEEEDALPGATLMRVHQDVRSRTGYEDAFEWSFAAHVREGRVVLIEFWIDRARARAAFGLES